MAASPDDLVFLLLGKTGSGKSSVGESILGMEEFGRSDECKSVLATWAEREEYEVMVVDGLSLDDKSLHKLQDAKGVSGNLGLAMGLCEKGVDAFILVIRYGERFSREEIATIEALNKFFGPKWLSEYCVVVMTFGNQWRSDMKQQGKRINFLEWCKEEKHLYGCLLAKCGFRCVSFEKEMPDKDGNEELFRKLLSFVKQIKGKGERFTNEHFKTAAAGLDKIIGELGLPILHTELQKEICLLTSKCTKLSDSLPYGEKMKSIGAVIGNADSLLKRITNEDKGTGKLDKLKRQVLQQKGRAQNVEKELMNSPVAVVSKEMEAMKIGQKEIEEIRQDFETHKSLAAAALNGFTVGVGSAAVVGLVMSMAGFFPTAGAAAIPPVGIVMAAAAGGYFIGKHLTSKR